MFGADDDGMYEAGLEISLKELQAQLKELREYAMHTQLCQQVAYHNPDMECTCGLVELLKESQDG